MGKTGEKSRSISSAKAVQEAKHSGGQWDERCTVKDTTGLLLNIKRTNSKSWLYRYSIGGKRMSPMGLGSYPEVSLKAAREIARHNAELLAKGIDPKQNKKRIGAVVRLLFFSVQTQVSALAATEKQNRVIVVSSFIRFKPQQLLRFLSS